MVPLILGMQVAFKRYLFILIGGFSAAFLSKAWALPSPEADPASDTRLFGEASYFKTTANYDTGGGHYTSLGEGNYYQQIGSRFGAEHWLLEDLSLIADVGFTAAESYDGVFTRNRQSFTDLTAGIRYTVLKEPLTLIPEILLTYPFYRVDPNTDEVLTGEGAMQIFGGLWAEKWLGTFKPYAEFGLLYQDGGRATLMLYTAGLAWRPGGWQISGELYGSNVLINDQNYDERLVRDEVTAAVDAGSWKVYSVNPSVLGFRTLGDVDLGDRFRVGLTFDQTINGRASAVGWTGIARVQFNFGARERYEYSEPVRRPKVLEPAPADLQKFEPEQPNYDSTLFSEPKPKPVKKSLRVIKPKKKKIDIDKSLEDVQKSLEN